MLLPLYSPKCACVYYTIDDNSWPVELSKFRAKVLVDAGSGIVSSSNLHREVGGVY